MLAKFKKCDILNVRKGQKSVRAAWVCRLKHKYIRRKKMKKAILMAAAAVVLLGVAGCGSARTPLSGPRSKNVWYNTFFGISIESAVYGDGLIVNQK